MNAKHIAPSNKMKVFLLERKKREWILCRHLTSSAVVSSLYPSPFYIEKTRSSDLLNSTQPVHGKAGLKFMSASITGLTCWLWKNRYPAGASTEVEIAPRRGTIQTRRQGQDSKPPERSPCLFPTYIMLFYVLHYVYSVIIGSYVGSWVFSKCKHRTFKNIIILYCQSFVSAPLKSGQNMLLYYYNKFVLNCTEEDN